MKIEKMLFSKGVIKYWNFNVDENIPFAEQEFELSEDLIQVEYENGKIIDVGWYPEFDINGHFVISMIEGQNWEKPVKKYIAKNVNELYKYICEITNEIDG